MLDVLAFLAFFGNGYQLQMKYEHCEKIEFKGDYCKFQKKLSKYEKK